MADVKRRTRVDENKSWREFRKWAAGIIHEQRRKTVYFNHIRHFLCMITLNVSLYNCTHCQPLSAPKPSSLYPSLKGMQNDSTFKDVLTRITPAKKLEPEPMEREKISISRLGWNRDQELSSVIKFRCRTDANLKSAAFLSKY